MRYHCGMYGFAEFHILSAAFAAVFAGGTAARLFGGRTVEGAAAFSVAVVLLRTVEVVFAPHAMALAYAAAVAIAALVVARRGRPRAFVGAAAAIALTFAAATCLDEFAAQASGRYYPVVSLVEAPLFAAAHLLIRAAAARALSCRVKRAYGASVELTVGEKSVEAAAFWDSGNTLTFRGTSPVVVLDGRVAEVLDGARVAGVMTVAGACGARGAVAYYLDRLKVRDSDGERAYADVVAVSVDRDFDGFDVLLNCGLS